MEVSVTIDRKSKLEVTLQAYKNEEEPCVYVQFLPRDSDHYVWDEVMNLIQQRMNEVGINTICENANDTADFFKIRGRPGTPNTWCDGYRMCGIAYHTLKEVQAMTREGMDLSAALDKAYDQPMQTVELGDVGDEIMVRMEPAYNEHVKKRLDALKRSIAGCLKIVVPLDQAMAMAEKLSSALGEARPPVPGDLIHNRGTEHDPLYQMVAEACAAVPEEKGRRAYVTGEVFDALEKFYTGTQEKERRIG